MMQGRDLIGKGRERLVAVRDAVVCRVSLFAK